jgi:hypothetical protein
MLYLLLKAVSIYILSIDPIEKLILQAKSIDNVAKEPYHAKGQSKSQEKTTEQFSLRHRTKKSPIRSVSPQNDLKKRITRVASPSHDGIS